MINNLVLPKMGTVLQPPKAVTNELFIPVTNIVYIFAPKRDLRLTLNTQ
jgi:hypothetical protein